MALQLTLKCEKAFFAAVVTAVAVTSQLAGCAVGPKDVRVISVTDVDLKDQTQFAWAGVVPPIPSKIISRIDFTTNTDLLALAKKEDLNVAFMVGPCARGRVKDNGEGMGAVYWDKTHIYFGTKDAPGYAQAIAKGPPFKYQAYASRLEPRAGKSPVCFTLTGGAMVGRRLRSNVTLVPLGKLTFSTLGCSKPVRFSPDAALVDSGWSNEVFEVKVKNQILCSAKIENPSFKIEGDTINLSYDADISGGASKCYCESSSRFDLTDIKLRKDYRVKFQVNYRY